LATAKHRCILVQQANLEQQEVVVIDLVSARIGERDDLSPKSRRMLEYRETVIAEWEKAIRTHLVKAVALRHPILVNTLPAFYDNIALLLTPAYFSAGGVAAVTCAAEHGGERARLTGYDATTLIQEYQYFRQTVFAVLRRNGLQLEHDEAAAINMSIDSAIRDAVTAFAFVHSAMREQFIAALTHDLRNPLANTTVAAQLIERGAASPRTAELARRILENSARMDLMIRELLDSMVFDSGDRLALRISAFDLRTLVDEVVEVGTSLHGRPLRVEGAVVHGYWCRESIKRALENLLSNAVKYGVDGAEIIVRLHSAHGRVTLSVHNEGMPIPADQVEAIFQIFRRAQAAQESEQEGWGVGLPYVRRVAESHGGSVTVTSDADTGTTFVIDMPADARPFLQSPLVV
jgi:signal transduction histidine kinase